MKLYAVMRAKQEEKCQETHEAIKYMRERQGKLLAMMERKRELMSEAPENLLGKILQEIRDLSGGTDLLEKKQVMKEILKGRRSIEVEEGRGSVVAGGETIRMVVAGSRSSETEGDLLSVPGSSSKGCRGPSCCWVLGHSDDSNWFSKLRNEG